MEGLFLEGQFTLDVDLVLDICWEKVALLQGHLTATEPR
jgi:hypothetical protein